MRENVSVLVPWRGGDPQRERVWEFIKKQWEDIGIELCVGVDDPGAPFNCSRALNRAFNLATKDVVMIFGADCLPNLSAMADAYDILTNGGQQWIPLFDRTEYFNEYATQEIMRGMPMVIQTTDPNLAVPFQTGVLAMRREAYKEAGGSDERFSGWGGEDSAFRLSLYRLYGEVPPLPYTLRCLWHDGSHRVLPQHNLELCWEYEAVSDRQGMLDLIAKRGYYV